MQVDPLVLQSEIITARAIVSRARVLAAQMRIARILYTQAELQTGKQSLRGSAHTNREIYRYRATDATNSAQSPSPSDQAANVHSSVQPRPYRRYPHNSGPKT